MQSGEGDQVWYNDKGGGNMASKHTDRIIIKAKLS
jgi:hypothetical protein